MASLIPHKSSHTVPHIPYKHTSTLPSLLFDPPTRRISPCVHSSEEKYHVTKFAVMSSRSFSMYIIHFTIQFFKLHLLRPAAQTTPASSK